MPALGFVRVTCQTMWPAIFYQQGPDLDSTLVPTWCRASVWMRERKKPLHFASHKHSPRWFSSPLKRRANPTPFADTYVWFLTHAPKGKKQNKTRKQTNKTKRENSALSSSLRIPFPIILTNGWANQTFLFLMDWGGSGLITVQAMGRRNLSQYITPSFDGQKPQAAQRCGQTSALPGCPYSGAWPKC